MVSVIDKLASFMPKDRPWCGPDLAIFISGVHKACMATPTQMSVTTMLAIVHSPFLSLVSLAALPEVAHSLFPQQKDANKT